MLYPRNGVPILRRSILRVPPEGTVAHPLNSELDYLDTVRGTNAVGYSSVASLTFLLYDVMLTFDDEVQLIWLNPWSFVRFVFFFIRYFPVMLQVSVLFIGTPPITFTKHECYIWNVYQAVSSTLIIAAVDYILILRIHVIYNQNRAVKALMTFLYVAELITISIGTGLGTTWFVVDEYCTVLDVPSTFLVASGAPIAFQTVLFVLTGYKFLRALKDGWRNVGIIGLLMRDGTWAFILIFIVLASEAMLYGLAPDVYTGIIYGWLNTVFAFCGYRILLNLNSLGRTRRLTTTTTPATGPDIMFETNLPSTSAAEYSTGLDTGSHELTILSNRSN